MTVEEIRKFKNLVNKNMHKALCLDGCSIASSERLAYAATIAEYVRGHDATSQKADKSVYDGIVHLEQMHYALGATIRLLKEYGCDSLSDITGYIDGAERILFRVKGRVAAAPIGFGHEELDLLNYARSRLGMSPLIGESPLGEGAI